MTYICPSCEREFGDEDLSPTPEGQKPRCPFDGTALKQKREKAETKDDA